MLLAVSNLELRSRDWTITYFKLPTFSCLAVLKDFNALLSKQCCLFFSYQFSFGETLLSPHPHTPHLKTVLHKKLPLAQWPSVIGAIAINNSSLVSTQGKETCLKNWKLNQRHKGWMALGNSLKLQWDVAASNAEIASDSQACFSQKFQFLGNSFCFRDVFSAVGVLHKV